MKAESTLKRSQSRGWQMGLRNLLSRENNTWWKTSRWWVQTLVWGLIINGILILLLFLMPLVVRTFEGVDQSQLAELPGGLEIFFSMAGIALPIGVVILVQGSVITEKERGTAEWVLSKPASRTAFILSKLIAHGFGILATMIIFQSGLAYGLIWLNQGSPLPVWLFLKGVGILVIMVLFYLNLTMMMEVLADKRGVVLGVSLGTALGGALLVQIIPGLAFITPFALPNMAPLVALGSMPAGFPVWLPVTGTAVMSLAFAAIALVKFNRKPL